MLKDKINTSLPNVSLASSDVYSHTVFDFFIFCFASRKTVVQGKAKGIDWVFPECECLVNKEMLNEMYCLFQ